MRVDCSKTVNFLREWARMCDSYVMCSNGCAMRELRIQHRYADCERTVQCHPETVIEIVQEWSDKHPVKTRLDDVKEKYPNIPLGGDGEPNIYPNSLGYCGDCTNCIKFTERHCWLEPIDGGATGKAVE